MLSLIANGDTRRYPDESWRHQVSRAGRTRLESEDTARQEQNALTLTGVLIIQRQPAGVEYNVLFRGSETRNAVPPDHSSCKKNTSETRHTHPTSKGRICCDVTVVCASITPTYAKQACLVDDQWYARGARGRHRAAGIRSLLLYVQD